MGVDVKLKADGALVVATCPRVYAVGVEVED